MARDPFDPSSFNWSNWAGPVPGKLHGLASSFFGGRGRLFEAGEIRLAILSLLEDGPKHGYELMKVMAARWGNARRVSAGSVYPTLQQLEDEGMITSEREGGRRVYAITDQGRAELKENAQTVKDMWNRAAGYEDWARWISPEMVFLWTPLGAVMKSTMRVVKQSRGDQERLQRVHAILDAARKALDELGEMR